MNLLTARAAPIYHPDDIVLGEGFIMIVRRRPDRVDAFLRDMKAKRAAEKEAFEASPLGRALEAAEEEAYDAHARKLAARRDERIARGELSPLVGLHMCWAAASPAEREMFLEEVGLANWDVHVRH